MENATALAKQSPGAIAEPVKYNQDQLQLIKDTYAKGATDSEFKLFVQIAERKGLDIFSRQVHLVKRWDSKLGREAMEPQTGIDGYRLMAERTQKYEGQLGPFWCGKDGEWKDVWLSNEPPAAAKVGTLKAGFREPLWAVALYKEYVQTKKDGTPTQMWSKMAANQLAKCAEALSLRKGFPSELAGIYTAEEMAQASNMTYDVEAVRVEPQAQIAKGDSGKLQAPTDPRRELLKEMIAELKTNGIAKEQVETRISELCDGTTAWNKLSPGDIEGLIEDFSRWLDTFVVETES